MAAAMVLRGARSGSSTRFPIPAFFRRVAQVGVAQGSSPAPPAAGMGRLTHRVPTSCLSGGKLSLLNSTSLSGGRLSLLNNTRGRGWSISGSIYIKSFISDDGHDPSCRVVYMLCAMSVGIRMVLPNSTIWRHFKRE